MGLEQRETDTSDKDACDLHSPSLSWPHRAIIGNVHRRVTRWRVPRVSRTVRGDPKRSTKIESTDPRVSESCGRRRRPRAASGQIARSASNAFAVVPERDGAIRSIQPAGKSALSPHRWACFGARTRERNDLEERPPDASHGCAHCGARFGPAEPVQRDCLRRFRAGHPECAVGAGRAHRLCAGSGRTAGRRGSGRRRPSAGSGRAAGPGARCGPASAGRAPAPAPEAPAPAPEQRLLPKRLHRKRLHRTLRLRRKLLRPRGRTASTGTPSPAASPVVTGGSAPATVTRAVCSSRRAPGMPTVARALRTARAVKSRSGSPRMFCTRRASVPGRSAAVAAEEAIAN